MAVLINARQRLRNKVYLFCVSETRRPGEGRLFSGEFSYMKMVEFGQRWGRRGPTAWEDFHLATQTFIKNRVKTRNIMPAVVKIPNVDKSTQAPVATYRPPLF